MTITISRDQYVELKKYFIEIDRIAENQLDEFAQQKIDALPLSKDIEGNLIADSEDIFTLFSPSLQVIMNNINDIFEAKLRINQILCTEQNPPVFFGRSRADLYYNASDLLMCNISKLNQSLGELLTNLKLVETEESTATTLTPLIAHCKENAEKMESIFEPSDIESEPESDIDSAP